MLLPLFLGSSQGRLLACLRAQRRIWSQRRPSGQETLVLAVGGQGACTQGSSLQTTEVWAPRGLVSTRTDELTSASCPSPSPQSQGQLSSGINMLSLRSPSPEAPHRAEALLLSSADFFYPQSPISASISRENLPRGTPLNT